MDGLNSEIGKAMNGLDTLLKGLGPKQEISVNSLRVLMNRPAIVRGGFRCYDGLNHR